MQRWAVIITAFYSVILVGLLLPGGMYLSGADTPDVVSALFDLDELASGGWVVWLFVAGVVTAQALLLFLSVDTSRRRLKPRQRIALSVVAVTAAVGLLCAAFIWSIVLAIWADKPLEWGWLWAMAPFGLWIFWGVVFYLYRQRISERLDRMVSWILNGSVLQLLVAVPCHIIVRQRGDCCAPVVTGYGIATGVAVMLMAFGPSVLFLYQKRLREYDRERRPEPLLHRWPVGKVLGTLAIGAAALFFFLPLERGWQLSFDLTPEGSPALTAAMTELTASLGVVMQSGEDPDFRLSCDGETVGSIEISPNAAGQYVAWTISLRSDQAALIAPLQGLIEAHTTDLFVSIGPSAIQQWRSKVVLGSYFGGSCSPQ